jgi:hypothetical protein
MTPDPPVEPKFGAADPGRAAAADPGRAAAADPGRAAVAEAGRAAAADSSRAATAVPAGEVWRRPAPRQDPRASAPLPNAERIADSPEELYELAGRLLERGDAASAAEVFGLALDRLGADHPGRGQLLGGLGIALLEQALAAFADAMECGDASVRPLAVELLARALPLRDRDGEAALVWQRGVSDHDPEVAAAVRARLRRSLGSEADSAPEFWWDGFMESAVCHGTLPVLANELFGAIDRLYALVAVPYARQARERELWAALAEAVRLPGGYAWGRDLQESFRARLRDAIGADSDVLPADWPDTR